MNGPLRLGYIVLPAANPHQLSRFYVEVLGLRHVREAHNELAGAMVELTAGAHEDHELVLTERPAGRHVAFRVESLEDLRALHAACADADIAILFAHDVEHAIAFFVRDPEGNVVELYWPTGRPRRPAPIAVDLADPGQHRSRAAVDAAKVSTTELATIPMTPVSLNRPYGRHRARPLDSAPSASAPRRRPRPAWATRRPESARSARQRKRCPCQGAAPAVQSAPTDR
jgi:catechol 2,3-dioxygenase-like lactoylglutathione lyase family enzyme